MPYVDDIIEEEKKAVAQAEPQKEEPKPEEKPSPEPQGEPEEKPEEKPEVKPEEQEPEETPKEEKPKEEQPKPKKDFSKFTPEERAEYGFAKRLLRERKKAEASAVESLTGKIEALSKTVETLKGEKKPKTRADYPDGEEGDVAYINDLTEAKAKQMMDERDKQAAKDAEERAREAAENARVEEVRKTFSDNVRETFQTEESYNDFDRRLKVGMENGLDVVLDGAPMVKDFIFTKKDGPAVLNAMLSSKDTFVRIMSKAADPYDVSVEMFALAKELRE
ncbi:MAG: hypothetical protein IIV56_05485, partial [Mailhella sp.]|nr:hypothetical protein [Mailhella sp.]